MKKIKGTHDLIFKEITKWQIVENKLKNILNIYNFQEIRTPIIEYEEVFIRSAQYSEMVQKETFKFQDKKGRKIVLRPEGTAPIVRSYIENKLQKNDLYKFFYNGPFFRYERPQKGRYRQFHQFGIEIIGCKNLLSEIEILLLIQEIINIFNLTSSSKIKINYLGNKNSRENFLKVFNIYINNKKKELCSLCLKRSKKNILRILDCKKCSNENFLKNNPSILDYLDKDSKIKFNKIIQILEKTQVNFEIDNKLVRGLDYYTDLVFELEIISEKNKKTLSLGGGGNYNELFEIFKGEKINCIGFAFGIERLISVLEENNFFSKLEKENNLDVFLFVLESELILKAFFLLNKIRKKNIKIEMNYKIDNFQKKFQKIFKKKPKYIIFLGKKEISQNILTIKKVGTKKEYTFDEETGINFLIKELFK
jgi:histidyl-tRNA synthetase